MSFAYPTAACDEGELAALTTMFKGNGTAASAFCDKLSTRVGGIEEGVNTMFMTVNGALVFIMHAGFAMVRRRACLCLRRRWRRLIGVGEWSAHTPPPRPCLLACASSAGRRMRPACDCGARSSRWCAVWGGGPRVCRQSR
jgi:hypothetical protein